MVGIPSFPSPLDAFIAIFVGCGKVLPQLLILFWDGTCIRDAGEHLDQCL